MSFIWDSGGSVPDKSRLFHMSVSSYQASLAAHVDAAVSVLVSRPVLSLFNFISCENFSESKIHGCVCVIPMYCVHRRL